MPKRPGRKSAAQTPAPKSERIYGSAKNPEKSASSESSAKSIMLSRSIVKSLQTKLNEFRETHNNKKVSLNDLKAVYRRGLGAYSSTHRPTITGGVPNTRNAWAMARVNKFLKKAAGEEVKKAYVQDDDLLKAARGKKIESGEGDCYYVSGECVIKSRIGMNKVKYKGTPYLVQAEVQGQGKVSHLRYGHAWIEDDENVYDFSNDRELVLPKQLYYAIGDIVTDDPKKYRKYTFEEARRKMLDTGIYGPWDIEVQYAKGGEIENAALIAPNGKPTNLNPEQYKLVRTPEFKAWFGDWENEPEKSSKVVDENGEPLVVWHYARRLQHNLDRFYVFRTQKQLGAHFGSLNQVKNLSDDVKYAIEANKEDFRLYQVFLNIRNPIRMIDPGIWFNEYFIFELDKRFHFSENKDVYKDWITGERTPKIYAQHYNIDGIIYLNRYETQQNELAQIQLEKLTDNEIKLLIPNLEDSWIAFYPEQIKLADGTNTIFDAQNPDIRFAKGGLIAPNGKKSNLNAEQYKLVRTPEFKAWFGDWENDPKNASKVVDENGEPLICYHGTKKKFYKFNSKKSAQGVFWFSSNKEKILSGEAGAASRDVIIPVFLNVKKIAGWDEYEKLMLFQIEGRFNGIKLEEDYVVFEPNQIKLADGTNTTFNAENPDIRFKEGGKMEDKIQLPDVQASEESLKRVLEMQGYDLIKSDKGQTNDKIQKMEEIQQTAAPQDVICANCSWEWNTADSAESDKYTCHKCGFDNTLFYTVFKATMPLEEIAKKHGVELSYLQEQLAIGKKHEMDEHTQGGTNLAEDIAEMIALHHLEELPDYYERLDELEYEFNREPDEEVDLVKYSVWYDGETYDFYNLGDAVDHIGQRNQLATIRDYDGRKIMGHEDIADVLNGRKCVSEYENGGNIDEISDEIAEFGPEQFLANQKEEADAILFSRRTQIAKFMICNAYIDMAKDKADAAATEIERQTWEQVADIWKETKEEVDDVIYMYEEGGVAGGCGCTKKFSKGGLAYGNSHDKGGMPMKVKSTGQNIEIEGGEGVINKRSMQMSKRVEFEGKSMTPCEVISKINQMGGGVKFDCSDVKEIIEKDGEF